MRMQPTLQTSQGWSQPKSGAHVSIEASFKDTPKHCWPTTATHLKWPQAPGSDAWRQQRCGARGRMWRCQSQPPSRLDFSRCAHLVSENKSQPSLWKKADMHRVLRRVGGTHQVTIILHIVVWFDEENVLRLEVCVGQLILMKNWKKCPVMFNQGSKGDRDGDREVSLTHIAQLGWSGTPCAWSVWLEMAESYSPLRNRRCWGRAAQRRCRCGRGSQTSPGFAHKTLRAIK